MVTEERAIVRVSRRFSAAPSRVFQVWTDPGKVQTWMAPPASGDEIIKVDLDARVGRPFTLVVRRGGEEVRHSGEYLEVVKPRRLVFTWVLPAISKETTLVSVDLHPVWSGTNLTLKHERVLPADRGRTEARWSGTLDAIATILQA